MWGSRVRQPSQTADGARILSGTQAIRVHPRPSAVRNVKVVFPKENSGKPPMKDVGACFWPGTYSFTLTKDVSMENMECATRNHAQLHDNRILNSPVMSDKLFRQFSAFVHSELGIKMPDAKKTMLQARLQKRLREVEISTFEAYYDYVFSREGVENELAHMIDVITTNKTDFFREPQHFEYLVHTILPRLIRDSGKYAGRNDAGISLFQVFKFWSAACSSGEEPYTLAMVLNDFATRWRGFNYSILATDISTRMLKKAKLGIYEHERVKPIPIMLRKRYLLKSKDKDKKLVRVIPSLRATVKFRRLNLMGNSAFDMQEKMDVIFLRNVLIYFDRTTQEAVLNRLCRSLNPYGYLFVGHSETLTGLSVPLIPVSSTVYRNALKE